VEVFSERDINLEYEEWLDERENVFVIFWDLDFGLAFLK
jgi:hypothetical protein